MLIFMSLTPRPGNGLALNPQPLPPGFHFADGSVHFRT